MRPTLHTLVRTALLTEARNDPDSFLSYVLGSDPGTDGNENEARMRRRVVARLIADEGVPVASFSSLAEIIAQHDLFKPATTASSEEWIQSVSAAWQDVLDGTGVAELAKDLGDRISASSSRETAGVPSRSAGRSHSGGRRAYTSAELGGILTRHERWVDLMSGGEQADLTDAKLPGIDLSKFDLSQAVLTRVNLTGAKLRGTILMGADLMGANLSGADLTRASLRGADLRGANLSGAVLGKMHILDFVSLGSPKIEDTDLKNAVYDQYTQFPEKFNPAKRGMIRARSA